MAEKDKELGKSKLKQITSEKMTLIVNISIVIYGIIRIIMLKQYNLNNILSIFVLLTMLLSYNLVKLNMYNSVCIMCASAFIELARLLVSGKSYDEAIDIIGINLTIITLSVLLPVFTSIFRVIKDKDKLGLESFKNRLYGSHTEPKKLGWAFKILMLSIIVSVIFSVSNGEKVVSIINYKSLAMLYSAQLVLPTIILLAYLTFTDLVLLVSYIYTALGIIIVALTIKADCLDIEYSLNIAVIFIITIINILRTRKGKQDGKDRGQAKQDKQ